MQAIRERIRRLLDASPDIRFCGIFGSVASGEANQESDLDVAIAADRPLDARRLLELSEALSLAANREVDLVDLMAASGPILKHALSRSVILKNEDKSLYARLIFRMLLDQADMIPYHDRILRERRTRFLDG